jgi:hypothetical protein
MIRRARDQFEGNSGFGCGGLQALVEGEHYRIARQPAIQVDYRMIRQAVEARLAP